MGILSAQSEAVEEVSAEVEIAKLGDNGIERIKTVEQFMKNNLDSDTYERLRYAVNSAESVELVEALINATAPAKLPIDGISSLEALLGRISSVKCSVKTRTVT
jgi:hypothetical protein